MSLCFFLFSATKGETMGLKSGPHGVRTFMRENIPDAFVECDSFEEVVTAFGCGRGRSVGLLDGNIMMMAVPVSVRSFDAYVALVSKQIHRAALSFGLVVVCFDEPENVPYAKLEEQRARDELRASGSKRALAAADSVCSTSHGLNGDSYTLEELRAVEDCHNVMFDRSARCRFVDEVVRCALGRLPFASQQLCVLIDGLDPAGCMRAFDTRRAPTCQRLGGVCYSVDTNTADMADTMDTADTLLCLAAQEMACDIRHSILERKHAIGEADIKLADVHRRVLAICRARAQPEAHTPVQLVVHVTTDLDQLPIDMLTEVADTYALQSVLSPTTSYSVLTEQDWRPATALMMKNHSRSKQNDSIRQQDSDSKQRGGAYTLVDVRRITRAVAALAPSRHPCEALASFCASFALGGCDFVPKNIPALRANDLIKSTCLLLHDENQRCGTGPPIDMRLFCCEEDCFAMLPSARAICTRASEDVRCHRKGRTAQTHADALLDVQDCILKRALWTIRYWSLNGHPSDDVGRWGFGQVI
jgi:hypothetical protein